MPFPKGEPREIKFTPEITDKILAHISLGLSKTEACDAVGITYATLKNWVKDGREHPEGKHGAFAVAILQARATSKARDLSYVSQAAKTDWKAATWRLEYVHQMRKIHQVDATITQLTADQAEARIKQLLAGIGTDDNSSDLLPAGEDDPEEAG